MRPLTDWPQWPSLWAQCNQQAIGHSVEPKVFYFAQEHVNQPRPSGKQVRTKWNHVVVKQEVNKCKCISQHITNSDYFLTLRSVTRNVESLIWLLGILAAKVHTLVSMIWNTTKCLIHGTCLYESFHHLNNKYKFHSLIIFITQVINLVFSYYVP